MRDLFDAAAAAEVKERLARLRPDSQPLWGKMNVAQAVAHCAIALESAVDDRRSPRMLVGRLFGRFIKPLALNKETLRRNTPTVKGYEVVDQRDLEVERDRLRGLIDRFVTGGPAGCTTHPHGFFGPMTPREWAILMYKHLDHHLRQFGV